MPLTKDSAQKELDTAGFNVPVSIRYKLYQHWRRNFCGSITFHFKDGKPLQVETVQRERVDDVVLS